MYQDEVYTVRTLYCVFDRAQIPLRILQRGDRLAAGDARFRVLHPGPHRPNPNEQASDNSNSIVLCIEYRGARILLTGDVEGPGMDGLLAQTPLDCDIILAPHHGSKNSQPEAFAAWSRPEWTVISGGVTEELAPSVLRSYGASGRILRTAETGSISFTVKNEGILPNWTHRTDPMESPRLGRAVNSTPHSR
jgi:competence protein ComEC